MADRLPRRRVRASLVALALVAPLAAASVFAAGAEAMRSAPAASAGATGATAVRAPAATSAGRPGPTAQARIPTAVAASGALSADAGVSPTAADPVLEAQMLAITNELRCLVCQNQTIAESHADLAVDLRAQVRELLRAGHSPQEIRTYMTDRYGDFVLYRPPLKPTTFLLWLGPALLLAVGAIALWTTLRRRSRLADDRFEPDPALDDEADEARADPSRAPAVRPGAPA